MDCLTDQWTERGRLARLLDLDGGPALAYARTEGDLAHIVLRDIDAGAETVLTNASVDCADLDAVAADGQALVVHSVLIDGIYRLVEARPGATPEILTDGPMPSVAPALAAAPGHGAWLACQQADADGVFQIVLRRRTADGWSAPVRVSDLPGHHWSPAVAALPDGRAVVGWDGYAAGSYDVYLRFVEPDGALGDIVRLSDDDRFHAHLALAPAPDGSVWAAWNRAQGDWGQDNQPYRRTRIFERNFLHARRFVEVRRVFPDRVYPVHPVLQDDHLDAKLPGQHHERPRLRTAPDGALHVGLRYNAGEPTGGHRNEKRWQAVCLRHDGAGWSDPVELADAFGLSTGAVDILPLADGRVLAAACGEGSPAGEVIHVQTRVRLYDLPQDAPAQHTLPAITAPTGPLPAARPRPRRHTVEHGGAQYGLYFGDVHRHTEFSYCRTSIDGSLEEAFRYARDAAEMDFCMTADHDHQEQAPDLWNEVMRAADRFHAPGHFVPFFGYEWIGGNDNRRHRNIVSADRIGPPPFDDEDGQRDIRATWATLPRGRAITLAHHTACSMSLLWKQDPGEAVDPGIEPVVEIFQASRGSSEHPGCPTLQNHFATSGQHANQFHVDGGWVSDALKLGIRMGFVASSDHMSTHASYACVYATACTREALIEALLARRCYAASDRILCTFRAGGAFMGEAVPCPDGEVPFALHFAGAGPLREITLLRDSEPYRTWTGDGASARTIELSLPADACRGHWFYARCIQEDSHLAWSSPIWLD